MSTSLQQSASPYNPTVEPSPAIIARVRDRQRKLAAYLNRPRGARFPESFRYNPVKEKNLEKVSGGLLQLLALLPQAAAQSQPTDTHSLEDLLDRLDDPATMSAHSAWELADAMVIELLRFGDDVYLYSQLQSANPPDDPHRWSVHFSAPDLDRLRNAYSNGGFAADSDRRETRRFLEQLQQFRIQEYRRDRALAELRGIYLGRMVQMLLAALALLVTAFLFVGDTPPIPAPRDWKFGFTILLVLSAGAMGSILSRAIKLGRSALGDDPAPGAGDRPLGIRALTAGWKVFFGQVGIGATAGLILYLVIRAGLIANSKEITSTAHISLLAFLAGFSEPFFIGTLDKIAGTNGKT